MFLEKQNKSKHTLIDLYIFPHAGGDVYGYNQFSDSLHQCINPKILQLPGRGKLMSMDFIVDMETLVLKIISEIKCELDKPYMFFGHSLGGIILFSLYEKMKQLKLPLPKILFISGVDDPCTFSSDRNDVEIMNDEALMSYLVEISSSNKNIYEDKNLREVFFPIIRADLLLARSFIYDDKRIISDDFTQFTYFFSSEDEKINDSSIDGWRRQCSNVNNFHKISIVGDHLHILNAPKIITTHINKFTKSFIGNA